MSGFEIHFDEIFEHISSKNIDYKNKIWSVRNDEGLSGKEKRKEVRNLKTERELAIVDARRNYYRAPRSN